MCTKGQTRARSWWTVDIAPTAVVGFRVLAAAALLAVCRVQSAAGFDIPASYQGKCHPYIHKIGYDEAVQSNYKLPLDRDDLLECNGAYMHGTIEAIYAHEQNALATTLRLESDFCAQLGAKPNGWLYYFECFHGMGHGIMQQTERNLTATINICSNLNLDLPTPAPAMKRKHKAKSAAKAANVQTGRYNCINGMWHGYALKGPFLMTPPKISTLECALLEDTGTVTPNVTSLGVVCARDIAIVFSSREDGENSTRLLQTCIDHQTLVEECLGYMPTAFVRYEENTYEGIKWCRAARLSPPKERLNGGIAYFLTKVLSKHRQQQFDQQAEEYMRICESGVGYRTYKTHPERMDIVEKACEHLPHCIETAVKTHSSLSLQCNTPAGRGGGGEGNLGRNSGNLGSCCDEIPSGPSSLDSGRLDVWTRGAMGPWAIPSHGGLNLPKSLTRPGAD
eukprot:346947-Prorocentrum_minimum.AAC.2